VITKTAIEKSGIVSLTRSDPFAFSYAIGGEVAAAVLQRNAIATMVKVVRVIATVHIISSLPCGEQKGHNRRVKYWEIIADNLSKAGWTWGCVSTADSNGRTIFIADARHGDGNRFVVRADETLTAVVELESGIHPRRTIR